VISVFFRLISGLVRRLPCAARLQTFLVRASSRLSRCRLDFTFKTRISGLRWSALAFPDLLTRHMLFSGIYQDDVLFALRTFAVPGSTVFDVGGHHGLMAIVAALSVGPAGRVISFEPNPAARRFFEKNISLNDVKNIRIESIGLSDEQGEVSFYVQRGTASWNSSLFQEFISPGYETEKMTIQTQTMDQFVTETGIVPNVVKIDIEGSEFLALKGARESIRRHHPVLIMEFNPDAAEAAGTTIAEIVDFLREESYRLVVFKKDRRRRYTRTSWEDFSENKHCRDDLANVVCLPRGADP